MKEIESVHKSAFNKIHMPRKYVLNLKLDLRGEGGNDSTEPE